MPKEETLLRISSLAEDDSLVNVKVEINGGHIPKTAFILCELMAQSRNFGDCMFKELYRRFGIGFPNGNKSLNS